MKNSVFPPFSIRIGIMLTVAIFSLSACDPGTTANTSSNTTAATTSSAASERNTDRFARQLTDGEILQVLYVHNNTEIRQAEQIVNLSDNHELREIAQLAMDDYGRSNEQIRVIVESGINLEPTELSRDLEFQADSNRGRLANLSNAEFNCGYLNNQEEQRQLVLDTLQGDQVRNAQDQRVRQLVSEVAPSMERHIEDAKTTRERVQCSGG